MDLSNHFNYYIFIYSVSPIDVNASVNGQLLKEHFNTSPPDMSPFFICQHVKGYGNDVFEPYPQLLTEMALRLPYQVHKYAENGSTQLSFDQVF